MKTTLLTIFGIFLLSQTAFSQNTTEQEWLYLTRGLTSTFSQGLDVKKGYFLDANTEHMIGRYVIKMVDLRREADSTYAGTYIVLNSSVSGKSYTLALRAPSQMREFNMYSTELFSQMTDYGLDGPSSSALAAALSERYSMFRMTKNR
jgi:hypothetical protein